MFKIIFTTQDALNQNLQVISSPKKVCFFQKISSEIPACFSSSQGKMIDLFARQRPAFSPSKATKTPPRKAFAIEWKAATPTNRCARLGAPFGKTAACAVPKLALARLRFSLVVEVRHLKQKELLYEIVRKFWPQNCGLGCDGRIGRCLSWCRSGYEKFDRFRAAFGLPPGGGSPSIDG